LTLPAKTAYFKGKGFTFAPTNKKPFNINKLGMTIMQNFTTRELIEAVLGLFVILLGAIALLSIGGF
jgi:hypothetical protein